MAFLKAAVLLWLVQHAAAHSFVLLPAGKGLSPGMDVMAVGGELQARGHDLYVPVGSKEVEYMRKAAGRHQQTAAAGSTGTKPGQLHFVTYEAPYSSLVEAVSQSLNISEVSRVSPITIGRGLLKALSQPCAHLVKNATAVQMLRDAQLSAVITLSLPIAIDSCGCIMSHLLGVPLVVADGNPLILGPPSIPQFGSLLTAADLETVRGKLINWRTYLVKNIVMAAVHALYQGPWPAIRQQAGLQPVKDYPGQCKPARHILLTSFEVEEPRSLEVGKVLVGPVSPRLPLPQELSRAAAPDTWAFLDSASSEDGVVLVGFGSSGIFGGALDREDYEQLALGFAALAPTKVLWPMAKSNLPGNLTLEELPLGDNTKVVPWVDYNDVLGHPNIKVFVTHSGVHSMHEAAFHGTPIVGVPFQFEQLNNAYRLVSKGMGEVCPQSVAFRSKDRSIRYNAQTFASLIQKVMHKPWYKLAASRIAARMQLWYKFRTPVQRAADEVEILLAGDARWDAGASFEAGDGAAAGDEQQQQQQQQEEAGGTGDAAAAAAGDDGPRFEL